MTATTATTDAGLLKYSSPVLQGHQEKLEKEREPSDRAKQELLDQLLPPKYLKSICSFEF